MAVRIERDEHCPDCDEDRLHEVVLKVGDENGSARAREPVRLATCQDCGYEKRTGA